MKKTTSKPNSTASEKRLFSNIKKTKSVPHRIETGDISSPKRISPEPLLSSSKTYSTPGPYLSMSPSRTVSTATSDSKGSRRSSQFSGAILNSTGGSLSRQQSNASLSTAALLSMSSTNATNITKFITPDGRFDCPKPSNNYEIEEMFEDLMTRRNFHHFSESARQQMHDYSISKKWMLVYQDLQSEFQKYKKAIQGGGPQMSSIMEHANGSSRSVNSPSHLPPEFYVRKIIENSITTAQLNDLWVSLRTEPLDWVVGFLDAQGQVAIANTLQHFYTRSNPEVLLQDDTLEREFGLVKCVRVLFQLPDGLKDCIDNKICIASYTGALLSTKLATRKLMSELLAVVAQYGDSGLDQLLAALEEETLISRNVHFMARSMAGDVKDGVMSKFVQWMQVIEATIEGRGKMGSLVGASDDYRSGGENAVLEYVNSSLLLMKALTGSSNDVRKRHLIGQRLRFFGMSALIGKFRQLHYDKVDEVIQQIEDQFLEDQVQLAEASKLDSTVDMENPVAVVSAVWDKLKGTEDENNLVGVMQNLMMATKEGSHQGLKLLNMIVSNIAMSSLDTNTSINLSIQKLYDALHTDDMARRALLESRDMKKKVEELTAERDRLSNQLTKAEHGLVGELQEELRTRDQILSRTKRVNEELEEELEELKKKHVLEKHQQELEMREMLVLVNSKSAAPNGAFDKNQIRDALQKRIATKKDEYRREVRKMGGSVEPRHRLHLLRSQMDNLQNEAAELENYNFTEMSRKPIFTQEVPKKVVPKKKPTKDKAKTEADLRKLTTLRQRLDALQSDANDIAKFNTDARFKELFTDKRHMALDRLKELESKYKGFGIDYNPDNIEEPTYRSLDPNSGISSMDEVERITKEIEEIENSESEIESEIESESSSDNEPTSKNHRVSSAAGFLAELEAKYMKGQADASASATPANNVRYSTANRYKRSTGMVLNNPNFLDELNAKFGNEKENEHTGIGIVSNDIDQSGKIANEGLTRKDSNARGDSLAMRRGSVTSRRSISKQDSVIIRDSEGVSQKNSVSSFTTPKSASAALSTVTPPSANIVAPIPEHVQPTISIPIAPSSSVLVAATPVSTSTAHEEKSSGKRESKLEPPASIPPAANKVSGSLASDKSDPLSKHVTGTEGVAPSLASPLPLPTAPLTNGPILSPPPPPPPPMPSMLSGSPSLPMPTPPPPPPMPPIFSGKSTPAPPPPPPPMPGMIGGGTPPPPPPPPPPGFISPNTSGANSPAPPAPPYMLGNKMWRNKTPSPLLPQSPSLFEKYPRPKRKLKQLHWEKLENTDGSFWKNAKAEKYADELYDKGILDDLEKAFAMREIKSLASKKKDDINKLTFLSRDVNQQFGINLHIFASYTVNEVVIKILKCDRMLMESPSVIEFLSKQEIVEVSNNLAKNLTPYSTDWEGISHVEDAKTPEKDPEELQRADQLYLSMMFNLQGYWSSRMRAIKVITSYEKDYTDLVGKLRSIDQAVDAINNSKNLRNVFDVILAVGNYMNDTSKQAQGFKLSTLQRLSFIKDDKNSVTFLHYVEKIIRKNYPEFNNWLEELSPVLNVVKLSIEQLASDCKEYASSIANVERSIAIGNLSDSSKFHPDDKILVKVLPVLPECRVKADLLSDESKLTMLEFERLMKLFGEPTTDKFAKNSFFKKFADFINEYKKAQIDNMKLEEEERVYEKRKAMLEEQEKRKKQEALNARSSSTGSVEVQGRGPDMMDSLLEKLKNAGPAKSDPSSARKRAMVRKQLLEGKKSGTSVLEIVPDTYQISPTPKNSDLVSAEVVADSPSKTSPTGNDDVGSRARNLLKELRSEANSSSTQRSVSELRKQRLKRKQDNNLKFSDGKPDSTAEADHAEPVGETSIDTMGDITINTTTEAEEYLEDEKFSLGLERQDSHESAVSIKDADSTMTSSQEEFVDASL